MTRPLSQEDIERRFTHHVPDQDRAKTHGRIRADFKAFATLINLELPAGREASLAFTALEEAANWAHAAIARENK